jgi:hypothetical protein
LSSWKELPSLVAELSMLQTSQQWSISFWYIDLVMFILIFVNHPFWEKRCFCIEHQWTHQ